MARIPVHTVASAPTESKEIARNLEKRMGKLLNIHAAMAHSPVVIAAYHSMAKTIAEHGSIDARTKEAIALAVGNQNGSDYCQAAHTLSGRKAGFTDDQIRAGDIDFDSQLQTITGVARSVSANTGDVPDALWEAVLEADWREDELAEAFAHIAANHFTNYFNHYARTDLDLPAAAPLND